MAARSSRARLLGGALLHLFATSVALHAHAGMRAGGGLRGLAKSRSSHGLRASAYRAAGASALQEQVLLGRQVPSAPIYVRKIGLANVTEPTAFPPPPPSLEPWSDNQPLDTSIGHYLISGFIAQPTVTPPPSQASMDLAFACPILLSWPREVAVSAPDSCSPQTASSGNWTNAYNRNSALVSWSTSCVDINGTLGMPSSTSLTTYSVSNGVSDDLFGTSLERKTPFGSYIELIDCGGVARFRVEEKVYKQVGEPDDESCKRYKSCDGVIYIQYFIKDARGVTVAMTGYTHIFASRFDITDPAGVKIATVMRNGWDPIPPYDCSDSTRREWILKFEKSPPGMWSAVVNQWPIAAMMTMVSQKDELRQPDGQVVWSHCEVIKTSLIVLFIGLFVVFCIIVPSILVVVFAGPFLNFFYNLEERFLPKRMRKPSKYGN